MFKFKQVIISSVPRDTVWSIIERIIPETEELLMGRFEEEEIHEIKCCLLAATAKVTETIESSFGGYQLSSEAIDEIVDHLKKGRKVGAIKVFRSETDAGLHDAVSLFNSNGFTADPKGAGRFEGCFR